MKYAKHKTNLLGKNWPPHLPCGLEYRIKLIHLGSILVKIMVDEQRNLWTVVPKLTLIYAAVGLFDTHSLNELFS